MTRSRHQRGRGVVGVLLFVALLCSWRRADAQKAVSHKNPILFVGLRPTRGQSFTSSTALRRLSEAQRLREIAGSVVRTLTGRQVLNHATLRDTLGPAYLVDFVDCRGKPSCVHQVVRKLANRAKRAVYGDYTVDNDSYRFRIRLIDTATGKLLHEVTFNLAESEKENRDQWRRELKPLLVDLIPKVAPPPGQGGKKAAKGAGSGGGGGGGGGGGSGEANGVPELTPISTGSGGGGGSGNGGGSASSNSSSSGGDNGGFVDDAALDAIDRGVAWHGYFQSYAATGTRLPFAGNMLIFNNLLQLQFESTITPIRIVGKPQLLFDTIRGQVHPDFRELYAARDYKHADVSIGERILTWGVTDFWPVVDIVNPRDFSRIQNWKPIDEKLPVPVIRTQFVHGPVTLRLIGIPLLRNSKFQLDPKSAFALPIPAPPGAPVQQEQLPVSLDNTGGGGALDLALSSWKFSLYGLLGRNPLPTVYINLDPMNPMALPSTTVENERVVMAGASIVGNIDSLGAILKAEGAYYYRLDNHCAGLTAVVGPGIPQCFYVRRVPTARATISLARQVVPGLDATLQFISEYTRSSDRPQLPAATQMLAPGFFRQLAYNPILTFRLQGRFRKDDFRPTFFAYWSMGDEDYFVNADLQYYLADGFALSLGGFYFDGYASNPWKNAYTFAGSLEAASNVYLRATAWF